MNKHIEDMAKGLATARNCICIGREKPCNECNWREGCYFIECCKTLTDQGYRRASDVAREIFEEIEGKIAENDDMFERCASRLVSGDYENGRSEVVGEILYFLSELKKKYESEDADDETNT